MSKNHKIHILGNRNDIEKSIATATKMIIARSSGKFWSLHSKYIILFLISFSCLFVHILNSDYTVKFYCPNGSTFKTKSAYLKNMKQGYASGPKKWCYGCWGRADGCSDPTGTVVSNSMFGVSTFLNILL